MCRHIADTDGRNANQTDQREGRRLSPQAGARQERKAEAERTALLQRGDLAGQEGAAGLAVRVTAAGTKSFVLFHRRGGKAYWETLGRWDENPQGGTLTVRDAIIRAKQVVEDLSPKGSRTDPRPERTRRLQDGNQPEGLKIGGGWEWHKMDLEVSYLPDIAISRLKYSNDHLVHAHHNQSSKPLFQQAAIRVAEPSRS